MDAKELQLIKELMEQLQSEMKLDKGDLGRRLGREEPKGIEIMKVEKSGMEPEEGEDMQHELEEAEELSGQDLEGDMEMGEDPEHAAKVLDQGLSPDEKLKQRLMKLRG